MSYRVPPDEMTITYDNKRKYLHPPTSEQIISFIDELGVTMAAFERFYGIRKDTIRKIKHGDQGRVLPAKHWHIIYEKIKPTYGIGFFMESQIVSKQKTKKVIPVKKKINISKKLLERLSDL